MAIFQILKGANPANGIPFYDDGLAVPPGAPGFSTTAVTSYVVGLGAGTADGFRCFGLAAQTATAH